MDDSGWLAERFEEHRARLHAMAYRMLGSHSEADDAVQDVWLRVSGRDMSDVANLAGWLTTVAGRVCLDQLRARAARPEEPLELPELAVAGADDDPEREAVLADSVRIALLVVLDTLTPAERLAFVLHDMFAVPFEQIGSILGRSPAAAKVLASRARRRVRTADKITETDTGRQRVVVEAFLAASRDGDFDALLALLDPNVVARAEGAVVPTSGPTEAHGARGVARQALAFSHLAGDARLALVNGSVGIAVTPHGHLATVLIFTIADGKIVELRVLSAPEQLRGLDLADLDA